MLKSPGAMTDEELLDAVAAAGGGQGRLLGAPSRTLLRAVVANPRLPPATVAAAFGAPDGEIERLLASPRGRRYLELTDLAPPRRAHRLAEDLLAELRWRLAQGPSAEDRAAALLAWACAERLLPTEETEDER